MNKWEDIVAGGGSGSTALGVSASGATLAQPATPPGGGVARLLVLAHAAGANI